MAKDRVDLIELLCKPRIDGDVDFLGEYLRVLADGITGGEVWSQTCAGHSEHNPGRILTATAAHPQRGHQGWHHRPAHPQDPGGQQFPGSAGAVTSQ